MSKIILNAFAAFGFGLVAILVAQVAFNMSGDEKDFSLTWFGLVFFLLGGSVGWYRVT